MSTTTDGERWVKIPHAVLDAGLTPQAFTLYAALRRHADNDTLETYVGRERLAGYLRMSKVSSVDRYTRELIEARLVTSAERWCSKRDRRDWVYEKDASHTVRGSNLYTIAAGQTGSFSGDPVGPPQGTPWVPQKGHELEPGNYNQGTTKGSPPAAAVGASEPAVIASDWTPNPQNRNLADTLGLPLDFHAAAFAHWARNSHGWMGGAPERRNGDGWCAAFGRYLHAYAEGRAETEFPGVGDSLAMFGSALVQAAVAEVAEDQDDVVEAAAVADADAYRETRTESNADGLTVAAEGNDTEDAAPTVMRQLRVAAPWLLEDPELCTLAKSMDAEGRSFYAIKAELDAIDRRRPRRGAQEGAA